MRVMVLVKANEEIESVSEFKADEFAEMDVFNEKLVQAGVFVAADGLRPSREGKRVAFDADNTPVVIDGPFAETKELVAGYWIWQVGSMDEAVEWIKQAPFRDQTIELRRIWEEEDFGAEFTAEVRAAEAALREQIGQGQ
ncbi:MAG: YciI family protein [Jatrophihabitans sp.]|uniref:YciI family protein n=1 Tax=Jatrophihabitans sp. TaxID=1932789 RepID=UPI003F811DBB